MGPCILSADAIDDPQTLQMRLTVNGKVKQNGSTAQMIFPVAAVVAFLSELMTLEPGDIISTGTPVKKDAKADPPVWLKPGDTIEIECPAIGVLRNSVADET